MRPLRVLTWHVHGSYLYYLTQAHCDFYLPVQPGRYSGRTLGYPWGDNVFEVPAGEVEGLDFDCVLFQSRQNYTEDQFDMLSDAHRRLPRVYLEHDPPREHPTGTRHVVDDPEVLLVHVTHFNDLMWDSNRTPTRVVEHGVLVPEGVRYTGELERGLVVINNLKSRGRRLRRGPVRADAGGGAARPLRHQRPRVGWRRVALTPGTVDARGALPLLV